MSTRISLTVNGEPVDALVEPRTHLADFLRGQLNLTGTHLGCEHGVCGACTLLIDGEPARSCLAFAVACDGADVRTVEGFGEDPVMQALREAFSREHALQCGYCTPGMLVSARDIVLRFDEADPAAIRRELSGNLCRCTGYVGIVKAVASVIEAKKRLGLAARPPVAAAAAAALSPIAPGGGAPSSPPRAAAAAAAPSAASVDDEDRSGWSRIEQSFTVAAPPEQVRRLFDDPAALAACLPGAELTEQDGDLLKGRMTVRFGPIRAAFAGEARLRREPSGDAGRLTGGGSDARSGSRAKGEVRWRLVPQQDGRTRVDVELLYQLGGSLAQFGRGGLVADFAERLTKTFAGNVEARLTGAEPAKARQDVDALSLFFSVLLKRLKGLFGR